MWRSRSASSFVLKRGSSQPRALSSLAFTKRKKSKRVAVSYTDTILAGRTNHRHRRCGCHFFATSSGSGNSPSGGDTNDDDDEGWIPPIHVPTSDSDGIGDANGDIYIDASEANDSLPKSKRIETILEVSRQVKEQDRLDRAQEETEQQAEALFQLSEEEAITMTDDEILKRLDEVLKKEEELEAQLFQKELEREEEGRRLRLRMEASTEQQLDGDSQSPDWLRNRRAMLGQDDTVEEDGVVPILLHTPLTADEIELLLEAHGGGDIRVVHDNPEAARMGGADGMIFCTGGGSSNTSNSSSSSTNNYVHSSPYLISTLSRVLIDHMKDRKLHEVGIAPSAKQNTTNRAAQSAPLIYGGGGSRMTANNPSESWRIVDCGNYIVHILDEATRYDLNLEDLWSGADPLWRVNVFDEDEVEDYCRRHPVPESFNGTGSRNSNSNSGSADGSGSGSTHHSRPEEEDGYMDGAFIKRLERTRFGSTRRHKPVVPQSIKNRDRRIGNKKRREQREQDYFGTSD